MGINLIYSKKPPRVAVNGVAALHYVAQLRGILNLAPEEGLEPPTSSFFRLYNHLTERMRSPN